MSGKMETGMRDGMKAGDLVAGEFAMVLMLHSSAN